MAPVEDQFPSKASDELKDLFRARAALQTVDGDCAESVCGQDAVLLSRIQRAVRRDRPTQRRQRRALRAERTRAFRA